MEDVGRRADRVIEKVRSMPGEVACFAHGHLLRVLAARWVDLAASWGRTLVLAPASLSELGWERDHPAVCLWNRT